MYYIPLIHIFGKYKLSLNLYLTFNRTYLYRILHTLYSSYCIILLNHKCISFNINTLYLLNNIVLFTSSLVVIPLSCI